MITLIDIQSALRRIRSSIYLSPCARSETFSESTGNQVYLKLDNLQRTDHADRVSEGLRRQELRRWQRASEEHSANLRLPSLLARVFRARRRDDIAPSPVQEL